MRKDQILFSITLNDHLFRNSIQVFQSDWISNIKYFTTFLNSIHYPVTKDFKEVLSGLTQQGHDLENAIMQHASKQNIQTLASRYADEILANLKQNKNKFMLGGCLNQVDGGHAMIYEFRPGLFCVYNTGAGQPYHERHVVNNQDHYSPIKVWELPSNLSREDLSHFIYKLLLAHIYTSPERQNTKQIQIYEHDLYQKIFPNIHFLGGKEISATTVLPAEQWPHMIKQFSSYSCSFRITELMLQLQLPNPVDWFNIHCRFKLYVLKDFVLSELNVQHKTRFWENLIQGAPIENLRSCFTSMDQDTQEHLLSGIQSTVIEFKQSSDADKESILDYLLKLHKIIATVPIKASSPAQVFSMGDLRSLNLSGKQSTQNLEIQSLNAKSTNFNTDLDAVCHFSLNGEGFINEINALILRCERLMALERSHEAFDLIENAIMQLPLPLNEQKEDWNVCAAFYHEITGLTHVEWLDSLQTLYINCKKKLPEEFPCPNQIATHMSLLAIRDFCEHKLSILIPEQAYYSQIESVGLRFIIQQFMQKFMSQYNQYPLIHTRHPIWDEKLNTLTQVYKKNKNDPLSALVQALNENAGTQEKINQNILRDLIETNPNLKQVSLNHFGRIKTSLASPLLNYIITHQLQSVCGLIQVLSYESDTNQITISEPAFQPHISFLNHYYNLERFIWSVKHHLGYSRTALATYIRPHFYHGYGLCLFENIYAYFIDHEESIQPKFASSQFATIFNKYSYNHHRKYLARDKSSNEIQLSTLDLDERVYRTLRIAPSAQIQLSLDYFLKNIQKLDSKLAQEYLKINLFEWNLLSTALKEDPELLERFDEFEEAGIAFFSKNAQFSQHSLYFIHVNFLVKRYAAQLNPNLFGPGLLRFMHNVLRYLEHKNLSDDVLSSLHRYYFLACVTGYELGFVDDLDSFSHALDAHLLLNVIDNRNDSAFAINQHELLRGRVVLQRWVRTLPEEILKETLPLAINKINDLQSDISTVNLATFTLSGHYPFFIFHDRNTNEVRYRLDLEKGLLFKGMGDYTYAIVPEEVKHIPMLKRFQLQNESSCWISLDQRIYMFETQTIQLRFIKQPKPNEYAPQTWCMQKIFRVQNQDQWYEHQDLAGNHQLPILLSDSNIDMWISIYNPDEVLITRDLTLFLRATQKNILEAFDEQGVFTQQVLSLPNRLPPKIAQSLAQFEDLKFALVFNQGQQNDIYLQRYGLVFTSSQSSGTSLKGTDWILSQHPKRIADNIASLHLIDSNRNEQYLVPIQRFTIHPVQSKLGMMLLSHDISGQIIDIVYAQADEKIKKLLKQYYLSEQYKSYAIHEGLPQASDPASALLLCYYYMGSYQLQKAWDVLVDCKQRLRGLKGTIEEIQYLEWIVDALPFESVKVHDIYTPNMIAIRLKALSLYTDCLRDGKKVVWSKKDRNQDYETFHEYYREKILESNQAFANQIESKIANLYDDYQTVLDYVDYSFLITEKTQDSLLQRSFIGGLSFQRYYLDLRIIETERHQLLQEHPLSIENQKRLEELSLIREKLFAHSITANMKETKIQYQFVSPIPTPELPTPGLINEDWSSHILNDVWRRSNGYRLKGPMAVLTPNITEEEAIFHFHTHYAIAKQPNAPERTQLTNFCQDYLKANFKIKPITVTPLLMGILYSVIHHPEAFPVVGYIASLEELIKRAEKHPAPSLTVSLLKEETISDPELEKIVQEQAQRIEETSLIPVSDSYQEIPAVPFESFNQLVEDVQGLAQTLRDQWQALEKQYEEYVTEVSSANNAEALIGQKNYHLTQEQYALAFNYLQSTEQRGLLANVTKNLLDRLQSTLLLFWEYATLLANQGPTEAALLKQLAIERLVQKRAKQLQEKDLIQLYIAADYAGYERATSLSRPAINHLQGVLEQIIQLAIEEQRLQRIHKDLQTSYQLTGEYFADKLLDIAADLISQNYVLTHGKNPKYMGFQFHQKKLFRKKQMDLLLNLGEGDIAKVATGVGKSKVISPMLLIDGLDGMEAPPALLETNAADLNLITSKVSGQEAHIFEFNRGNQVSPVVLKNLYHYLASMRVFKDYYVFAGVSVQSLNLKFFEICRNRPSHPHPMLQSFVHDAWSKQVFWLDALVKSFRRSRVIIDEVHINLSWNTALHQTLAVPVKLSEEEIQYSVALYRFLGHVPLPNHPNIKFLDLLRRSYLVEAYEPLVWVPYRDYLIEHLFEAYSPISPAVLRIIHKTPERLVQAKQYLRNQGGSIPNWISKNEQVGNVLAFYKDQFNTILPLTLKKQFRVEYGPFKVKEDESSPNKKMVNNAQTYHAMPYLSKDIPAFGFMFGHPLVASNTAVQNTLLVGLNVESITEYIKTYQTEAQHEAHKKNIRFSQTKVAESFKTLTAGIELETINPERIGDVMQVYPSLRYSPFLLFDALQNKILPSLEIYEDVLHSNNYDKVDYTWAPRGYSGTIAAPETLHHRLNFKDGYSKGSDFKALEILLQKNTPIIGLDFTNLESYLSNLYINHNPNRKLCAIVDVGAALNSIEEPINNVTVARQFAALIQRDVEAGLSIIQYVLFFNMDKQVCAFPVKNNQPIIILDTSDIDEITRILKCRLDELAAYYDKYHSFGVDYKLDPTGEFFVFVGPDTTIEEFVQACGRPRSLERKQSIRIIVPQRMAHMCLQELFDLMFDNQYKKSKKTVFITTQKQMKRCVRDYLEQHILDVNPNNADLKHLLTTTFEKFFIDSQRLSLFERFGQLENATFTSELLYHLRDKLLKQYIKCIQSVQEHVLLENKEKPLRKVLNALIKKNLLLCDETYMSKSDPSLEDEIAIEQMEEAEEQDEQQQEHELDNSAQKQQPKPVGHASWLKRGGLQVLYSFDPEFFIPIAQIYNLYSDNIFVTGNFLYTYLNQPNQLNAYSKSGYAILFYQTETHLRAILVDNHEIEEIKYLLQQEPNIKNIWLTTTLYTHIAGHRMPLEVVRKYIEEICLFTGDLICLLKQEKFDWLQDNTAQKFEHFESDIKNVRQTNPQDLIELKSIFFQKEFVINYLIENIFSDLTEIDWLSIRANLLPDEVKSLQLLSQACFIVNRKWQDVDDETLLREYNQVDLSMTWVLEQHITKRIHSLRQALLFLHDVVQNPNHYHEAVQEHVEALSILTEHQDNFTIPTATEEGVNIELFLFQLLYIISESPFISQKQVILDSLYQLLLSKTLHFEPPANVTTWVSLVLNHVPLSPDDFALLQTLPQNADTLKQQLIHPQLTTFNIAQVIEHPLVNDEVMIALTDNETLPVDHIEEVQTRYPHHTGLQKTLSIIHERQLFIENLLSNQPEQEKIQALREIDYFSNKLQKAILTNSNTYSSDLLMALIEKPLSIEHYRTLLQKQRHLNRSLLMRLVSPLIAQNSDIGILMTDLFMNEAIQDDWLDYFYENFNTACNPQQIKQLMNCKYVSNRWLIQECRRNVGMCNQREFLFDLLTKANTSRHALSTYAVDTLIQEYPLSRQELFQRILQKKTLLHYTIQHPLLQDSERLTLIQTYISSDANEADKLQFIDKYRTVCKTNQNVLYCILDQLSEKNLPKWCLYALLNGIKKSNSYDLTYLTQHYKLSSKTLIPLLIHGNLPTDPNRVLATRSAYTFAKNRLEQAKHTRYGFLKKESVAILKETNKLSIWLENTLHEGHLVNFIDQVTQSIQYPNEEIIQRLMVTCDEYFAHTSLRDLLRSHIQSVTLATKLEQLNHLLNQQPQPIYRDFEGLLWLTKAIQQDVLNFNHMQNNVILHSTHVIDHAIFCLCHPDSDMAQAGIRIGNQAIFAQKNKTLWKTYFALSLACLLSACIGLFVLSQFTVVPIMILGLSLHNVLIGLSILSTMGCVVSVTGFFKNKRLQDSNKQDYQEYMQSIHSDVSASV